MHALFEEAGKFMAGRILSEADTSAQVELDSGKRVKVKAANILLKFEKPAPAELIAQAQAVAETIELDLAWEFAPEDDFGFADLARDYFSENATLAQQAGALFRLYEAPHYFRRAGKGRFKKAPAEILQQALAAIEKKKALLAQIDEWAAALGRGECPQPIRDQLYKILFKPDKNAPEYKAVVEASRATHTAPLDLLQKENLVQSVAEVAPHFENALHGLKGVKNVIDIRNYGLAGAIQIAPRDGDAIVRPFDAAMKLWKAGFYVRYGGDTLQFGPTFNSKPQDLDRLFDAVGEALNQID